MNIETEDFKALAEKIQLIKVGIFRTLFNDSEEYQDEQAHKVIKL